MFCRKNCALACPLTDWDWVLDDKSDIPPEWRICYALVGIPNPLPIDQWGDMLNATTEVYGRDTTIKGLLLAKDYPVMEGWTQNQKQLAERLSGYRLE